MGVPKHSPKITESPNINENEFHEKLDFIYRAINSTQEIIRFSDTKAGTVIVLITALIAATISFTDKFVRILKDLAEYALAREILILGALLFITFILTALVMALKSINPSSDTTQHVDYTGYEKVPRDLYYITGLNRKFKLKDYIGEQPDLKMVVTFADYYHKITQIELESLLKSLTAELLKVSYIKEKKLKRTAAALKCIVLGICTLSVTVIVTILVIQISQWV